MTLLHFGQLDGKRCGQESSIGRLFVYSSENNYQ